MIFITKVAREIGRPFLLLLTYLAMKSTDKQTKNFNLKTNIMKQPEVFKNLRFQFENPMINEDNERKRLNAYRDRCLDMIKDYKKELKDFESRTKERENVLKYFDYLDKLDKS